MGSQSDGRDLPSPTLEMQHLYSEIDRLKQEHTELLNGLKNRYETTRASLVAQIQQLDKVTDDAVKKTQYSFKQRKELIMREVRNLETREKNKKGAIVFERLPAEVLGIIFDEFVNGEGEVGVGGSPWTLAFVCRFWYTTVLSTPRLWRTLLVTDRSIGFWTSKRQVLGASNSKGVGPLVQPSGPQRQLPSLWSATQVCGNPTQLRIILQRSGVSPLDVTLAFAQLHRFDLSDLPLPSIQMLYMLFTPPVCTRISHLELDSSRGQYLSTLQLPASCAQSYSVPSSPHALPTPLTIGFPGPVGYPATGYNTVGGFSSYETAMLGAADIFKGPLTRIRSLSLHDYNVLPNWPIIQLVTKACDSSDHPGLGAVRLYISGLPTQLVDERKLWSKVKYLQLDTVTDLNRLLVGDVEVEELMLGSDYSPTQRWKTRDDVPEAWPNRGTLNVNFLRLTSLSIVVDDFSILSRLTFPVLQSLEITAGTRYHTQSTAAFGMTGANNADIAAQYAHPDFVVPLPSLKSLKVRSPHCAPLAHFQMPVLEKLHLTTECKPKIRCEADLEPFFFPNDLKQKRPEDAAGSKADTPTETENPHLVSNAVTATRVSHFKTLREFHFGADLTDKAVVRIIKALPALRVLSLRLTKRVGLKIFEELAIGKITGRVVSSITAPDLRIFKVDCTGEVEDVKKKAKKNSDQTTGRIDLDPPEPTPTSAGGAGGAASEPNDADSAKTLAKAMTKLATTRKRFWTALETCEVVWPDGKVETF